jgi:hypothetical protein
MALCRLLNINNVGITTCLHLQGQRENRSQDRGTVEGVLTQRSGFNPRSAHTRFVSDDVQLAAHESRDTRDYKTGVKVKLSLCLIKSYPKDTSGNGSTDPPSSTSALHRVQWSDSRLGRFTHGKAPGTIWTGGWVGSRASAKAVERDSIFAFLKLELRPSSPLLVAIQTELYRLHNIRKKVAAQSPSHEAVNSS